MAVASRLNGSCRKVHGGSTVARLRRSRARPGWNLALGADADEMSVRLRRHPYPRRTRCGRSPAVSGACALAMGLVYAPEWSSPVVRTGQRVALALRAAERGYAVVEVFEVDGNPVTEDSRRSP
jgi:hypothetical protein